MYMLNRKTIYEIIRELIINADAETIMELINNSGFKDDSNNQNIEYRRQELLSYLDEMNKCWNERYLDMTDRQYIKILE